MDLGSEEQLRELCLYGFHIQKQEMSLKRYLAAFQLWNLFLDLYVSQGHPHCLHRRDTKESTCLLRHITTEKSGLCQYAVCITRKHYVIKSNKH